MGCLFFQVSGESHGPGLAGTLTGLPAGIPFDDRLVRHWLLLRRTRGMRGSRLSQEPEAFEILSGVTSGCTNGGPLTFVIPNCDRRGGSVTPEGKPVSLEFPRPGHADLAGALKWGLTDATSVAELASARITAAYTLVGAVCQMVLNRVGISTLAHTAGLGPVRPVSKRWLMGVDLAPYIARSEASRLLVLDEHREVRMVAAIEAARAAGDSLGGTFEVVAAPLPAGLGAPQPLPDRLDGRLAGLVMAIPGVRAVALGGGFDASNIPGSRFHDPIGHSVRKGYFHGSNRAGGLEGGMTNGEPLVVRGVMKAVPSLGNPLPSASLASGADGRAARVRGDVCAVSPAAIVARSFVAYVLADALVTEGRLGGI